MVESIFTRISRIVSATVEDSVDRLERAGGETVMREAIREADRAVDGVKAEREAVMARRLQAARQQSMFSQRIEALTSKARFAVDEGRDDLAEAALSQQIEFEAQVEALREAQAQAREEEARLDEGLAALRARRTQMADTLAAYVLAQREAQTGAGPSRTETSAERKVDAAEQAFERAMAGTGGCGLPRTGADTMGRVAEIDVLQKRATIAERLAALKAQKAA